jgi:hypothetical protein
MTPADHSCFPFHEGPVFGRTQFTGRTRLVQNLLSRCARRQSILLHGGPKLGKTSMLLHLKWLMDQDREVSRVAPALYLDLSDEAGRKQFLLGHWSSPAPILLLDNCDHLRDENYIEKLHKIIANDSFAHAIVWAGARLWHDFVLNQRWAATLRRVPLAVLLQGEARELVAPRLTPDQSTAVLATGGTHPYVLKVLAHNMLSVPGDSMSATSTAREQLLAFFQACRETVRNGAEETLLRYLVQEARPVNPREAAGALGLPTIKSAADALCWVGLISRWNLNEGAMLQANCRIFNDWYLTPSR